MHAVYCIKQTKPRAPKTTLCELEQQHLPLPHHTVSEDSSFFSLPPLYPTGGGTRVQEILELDMSWKVLDWTEFEKQSGQLVVGWSLDGKMKKGDLTKNSLIKSKKHFLLYILMNQLSIIHIRSSKF